MNQGNHSVLAYWICKSADPTIVMAIATEWRNKMPRTARKASASGYYHVTARGNGRQVLFETASDYVRFLSKMREIKYEQEVKIIAWCLMDNHIHLLLGCSVSQLSLFMRRLLGSYAAYVNKRTKHVGHVFQQRFYSDPVEDDARLLVTQRYIHNNPVRANIASASDYRWSSYSDYIRGDDLTDTELVLDLLGGIEGFVKYCNESISVNDVVGKEPEISLKAKADEIIGLDEVRFLSCETRADRDSKINKLHSEGLLSIRQIERLTGIGRGAIETAIKRAGK